MNKKAIFRLCLGGWVTLFLWACSNAAEQTVGRSVEVKSEFVKSVSPPPFGKQIDASTAVSIEFTKPISNVDLTGLMVVRDEDGATVTGTISKADAVTLRFVAAEPFGLLRTFAVSVEANVTFDDQTKLDKAIQWQFEIREGGWGGIKPIALDDLVDDDFPVLYKPAEDMILMTWIRTGDSGTAYFYSRRFDGPSGVWGAPKRVDQVEFNVGKTGSQMSPDYAFDFNQDGEGVFINRKQGSLGGVVSDYVTLYRYNTEWVADPVPLLESVEKGVLGQPDVSLSNNGDAFMTWKNTVNGGGGFGGGADYVDIKAMIIPLLGDRKIESLYTCANNLFFRQCAPPVVTALSNGNTAAAVFGPGYSSIMHIPGSANPNDSFPTDWSLNEPVSSQASNSNTTLVSPILKADAEGNMVSVWFRHIDGYRLWVSQRVQGGNPVWSDAVALEPLDAQIETIEQPDLSVAAKRQSAVVWKQIHTVNGTQIWANLFIDGAWTGPRRVDDTDQAVTSPKIGIDDKGHAIAIWQQFNGTYQSIWLNRYVDGWGTPQQLSDNNSGDAANADVVVYNRGPAMVVWSELEGRQRLMEVRFQ